VAQRGSLDQAHDQYRESSRRTESNGMAAPFFHIPTQEPDEDDTRRLHNSGNDTGAGSQLDEWDAYHIIMMAYPGYTVGTIQDELSWRELNLLVSKWEKTPPGSVKIDRIEMMISHYTGIKFQAKKQSSDQLLDQLKGLGWLP